MYDVIIIGAGVAGLAAAKKLHEEGKTVLVLEARNRIGGRIHTDRHHSVPVDLGGSWAHGLEDGRNGLVEQAEYGLKLHPFSDLLAQIEDHVAYDEYGARMEAQRLASLRTFVKSFFAQMAASRDVCLNVEQMLLEFECDGVTSSDAAIFRIWLKNLMACWSGGELTDTSIEVWKAMMEEGDQAYVTSGYDVLIAKLAQGLDIRLRSPVTRVDYSDEVVRVMASEVVYEATAVVITLPIGVLKSGVCRFVPELSSAKQAAIAGMGSGVLDKAVLYFDKCFWDADALSIQRLPSKESPVQVYINYQPMFKAPVLVAMYGGDVAESIEKMSDDEARELFLAPLRKLYGDQFVMPTEVTMTRWRSDPYARCAYAYLPRGVDASVFDCLAKPVNERLFFAGEATDKAAYASVHGAYKSGLRVADEVLNLCW